MITARAFLVCMVCLFVATIGRRTTAEEDDDVVRAEALFTRAVELAKEGNMAKACPLLEESYILDPAMGTMFRLAECYEATHRPAPALTLYDQVAQEASKTGQTAREEVARSRAEALRARIATLVLRMRFDVAATPKLRITVDGADVGSGAWKGGGVAVDVGDHVLHVIAPGKAPFQLGFKVEKSGTTVEVRVPSLQSAPAERRGAEKVAGK
jgi:tetratricopeptide (TPR) repeat protein